MPVLPYPELYKDAPFVVLSDWVSTPPGPVRSRRGTRYIDTGNEFNDKSFLLLSSFCCSCALSRLGRNLLFSGMMDRSIMTVDDDRRRTGEIHLDVGLDAFHGRIDLVPATHRPPTSSSLLYYVGKRITHRLGHRSSGARLAFG